MKLNLFKRYFVKAKSYSLRASNAVRLKTLLTTLGRRGIAFGIAFSSALVMLDIGLAFSEGMSIEETIKSRQHSYRDLGGAFKSVRDQLRQKKPNIYLLQPTIQQMKDLADIQTHWFPAGSGPESGVETEAKEEIWQDPEGFAKAQQNFANTLPEFLDLAYANDIEGLKKHFTVVGKTCQACHDQYREED